MYKIRLLLQVIFSCYSIFLFAQVENIHVGNAPMEASAIAQFDATDRGILIPRMTEEDRLMISNPVSGLLVFDLESDSFWYFNGLDWVEVINGTTTLNSLEDTDGDTKIWTEKFPDEDVLRFDVRGDEKASIDNSVFKIKSSMDFYVGRLSSSTGEQLIFNSDLGAFRVGKINGAQWSTNLLGMNSFAFGENTTANGDGSAVWGFENLGSGSYSTAFGSQTEASGDYSMACGLGGESSGLLSTVFGSNGEAIGDYSTCFGQQNTASGEGSTAFGFSTEAVGEYSSSFGALTQAIGDISTTMGLSSIANGKNSTAIGTGVVAESFAEVAFGRYNTTYTPDSATDIDPDDRLFVIGNGTSDSNRKDAFSITKSGEATSAGTLVSFPRPNFNTSSLNFSYANNDWEFRHSDYELSMYFNNGFNSTSDFVTSWNFDGQMDIGSTFGNKKLNVSGDASKSTSGAWLGNSDRRLKKEIETVDASYALSQILKMQGVSYEWIVNIHNTRRPPTVQHGFIAQDLKKLWPDKVDVDDRGFLQTAYGDFDPMFVESFKAQQEMIAKLKSEQKSLNDDLNSQAQLSVQIKQKLELLNEQTLELVKQFESRQLSSETSVKKTNNDKNISYD